MPEPATKARTAPLAGNEHVHRLRVYFEDTDAGGIVYYANYLKFAERARSELLSSLGFENSTLLAEAGIAFAVRRCTVDYLRPARLDDRLEVVSTVLAVGGATLDALQRVRRDGEDLAVLNVRLACVSSDGRPGRMPRALRDALAAFISTS